MSTVNMSELQKGIYSKLAAVSALQSLIGNPARIYDVPPPDATYPLVTIGEDDAEEWGAIDMAGARVTVSVHGWGRNDLGRQQVKKIAAAANDALHEQSITVTGHAVVLCQFRGSRTDLDADGLTWHSVSEFTILIHPT